MGKKQKFINQNGHSKMSYTFARASRRRGADMLGSLRSLVGEER